MKSKILILCTGNSCRSQLAEGVLKQVANDLFEIHSAGSNPAGRVHPQAIAVLREIGFDITDHHSKHMDEFLTADIDTVITVCDKANESCPIFPGAVNRYHWGFEDPPHAARPGEEPIEAFRRIRDQIRNTFEAFAAGYRQALASQS